MQNCGKIIVTPFVRNINTFAFIFLNDNNYVLDNSDKRNPRGGMYNMS